MNRHVQACIGRTNSSRWSACCGPKPEGQRKERYMRITTAYLSGWLLHVIGSVAADRGVYGSAHSIHLGRDQSRMLAVALIRQRSCSYSRRGPTRAGVVVEESSLLWKRCAARVLVTCGAVACRCWKSRRRRGKSARLHESPSAWFLHAPSPMRRVARQHCGRCAHREAWGGQARATYLCWR
jgi:hypothetical protein